MSIEKDELENVLDSRKVIEAALKLSGRSKYAFARAADMAPQSLSEYLKINGRQMSAKKLGALLKANGIGFKLTIEFDDAKNDGLRRRGKNVQGIISPSTKGTHSSLDLNACER